MDVRFVPRMRLQDPQAGAFEPWQPVRCGLELPSIEDESDNEGIPDLEYQDPIPIEPSDGFTSSGIGSSTEVQSPETMFLGDQFGPPDTIESMPGLAAEPCNRGWLSKRTTNTCHGQDNSKVQLVESK